MPWQYIDGQQVWIPEEGQATPSGDWFGNILSSFKSNNEQKPAAENWSNVSPLYDQPVEKRMAFLQALTGQSEPISGQGPNAEWRLRNGSVMTEGAILNLYGTNPAFFFPEPSRATTGGTPAYVSAAQAENYRASAELARAQAADIPARREQERQQLVIEEAKRKFGEGAQLIGLQTNNQDLANRGSQIVFDQSNAIAQARNRIQELNVQQGNLQQQYNYNTSAANAAAANAVAQFNAQMGFNVEQANVAAQQRKQEQLQSLARDISEAAKAPGDYGKLAALTLANAGWAAPGTAIGKGEDLRTTQSLAPLESQLRTRQDVMAQPDRPFSYTPITPTMVQAPVIAPVDVRNFALPEQTMTTADVNRQKREGLAAIAGLGSSSGAMSPGAYMSNLASQLQSGASSADVNAQLNAAIANQIKSLPGPQGESGGVPAAAEGGIVPRYEDGGVNNSSDFNPIAVYQMLRSGGANEQQAADFINTILRSDAALASNTAAQQAQQQQAQPMDIEQVATKMPPAMYSPASGGYYATEDAAPAAAGWTPQIAQAQQSERMQWVPAKTITPEEFRNQENERKNREMFESIFGGLMAYPGGGAGARGAGSLIDLAGLLRNPRTRVLMTEYAPVFDEIQRAFIKKMPGVGYATGGIAPGAYISGERGPELNIPLGDKTIVLNQKQMKAAGIDLKKLMAGSKKPEQFAKGGVNPRNGKDEKWEPTGGGGGGRGGFSGGDFPAGYPGGGYLGPQFITPENAPTDSRIAGIPSINPRANQYEVNAGNFYKLPSDLINMLYEGAYQNAQGKGSNPDAVRWLEGFLGGLVGYKNGGVIPRFANGGIFDAGWGNVQDQDRTMSMQFLNDALARARAGTPFQEGALPAPVYASTPGFSPLVTQVLGSLTSMAQGVPTEYFQELAAKYRPSGIRESVTQRSA